jgi:N-acetylmuramoyl-L-alanine amidase
VVLAIARELEQLVRRERGMRPVMTRSRDVFLPLRSRVAIARKHKADLFVSIHADAYDDRRVAGSSVYALSPRGATSEAARWLAERENAADLVGGVKLDDKDDLLASVLLDLSQTGTIEASLNVGDRVLRELGRVGEVHRGAVQQAGFLVLKSPDVPSILVETAFISNPDDEQRLSSAAYQKSTARAILAGIRRYFADYAPPGTLLAARKHVIGQGESLAALAQRYQISPEALRAANGLRGESLPVGKVLNIPADRGS